MNMRSGKSKLQVLIAVLLVGVMVAGVYLFLHRGERDAERETQTAQQIWSAATNANAVA